MNALLDRGPHIVDRPGAKTLTAAVLERLRADILDGGHAPNARLRLETLRARYRVGLSPLREALTRLAAEGLVIASAQRGFRVAPISPADLTDLTMLRSEIESLALRRAIAQGDDAWEAEIVRAFHHLSRSPQPIVDGPGHVTPEWERRHRAFHASLAAACGSPRLLHIREQLFDQSDRYRRLAASLSRMSRDIDAEHRALMEATLARDADRAERLVREHIGRTAAMVRAIPSEDAPVLGAASAR